jgi:hypothetical protein
MSSSSAFRTDGISDWMRHLVDVWRNRSCLANAVEISSSDSDGSASLIGRYPVSNAVKFIKRHILSFKIDEGWLLQLSSTSAIEEEWPKTADGRSLKHQHDFDIC